VPTSGNVRTDGPIRHALFAGEVLTITADAVSGGRVGRLADTSGSVVPDVPSVFQAIAASGSLRVGPFQIQTYHLVEATAGVLSYAVTPAIPHLPISGAPTDVIEMFASGAPTDGTTGLGVAGIGSRYTNLTTGKLYLNAAAKTSPVWKIVTSA
jgi:hypothetical protein